MIKYTIALHAAKFSKPERLYSSDAHPEKATVTNPASEQILVLTCTPLWSEPIHGKQRNPGYILDRTRTSWGAENISLQF